MIQTLAVYAIVALATAWTVWSLFLRDWLRRRATTKAKAGFGPECACED